MKPNEKEIQNENKKLKYIRFLVDLTSTVIRQETLSIPEALEMIHNTKKQILMLFPGKEETYNLIYKPRFERLIKKQLEIN